VRVPPTIAAAKTRHVDRLCHKVSVAFARRLNSIDYAETAADPLSPRFRDVHLVAPVNDVLRLVRHHA